MNREDKKMSTHILHMDHGEWGLGVIIAIDENGSGCWVPAVSPPILATENAQ